MGVRESPVYAKVIRWGKAIPQYNIGYPSIIGQMEKCEQDVPGLFLCNNYRGGIAVGDCVMSGEKVAGRVLSLSQPPSPL